LELLRWEVDALIDVPALHSLVRDLESGIKTFVPPDETVEPFLESESGGGPSMTLQHTKYNLFLLDDPVHMLKNLAFVFFANKYHVLSTFRFIWVRFALRVLLSNRRWPRSSGYCSGRFSSLRTSSSTHWTGHFSFTCGPTATE